MTTTTTTSTTAKKYSVQPDNYLSYVKNALNGQETGTFTVGQSAGSAAFPDPAESCPKLFTASYTCGSSGGSNVVALDAEAFGKTATFSCSKEVAKCSGFRLTLGDDGNLVMTNRQMERTWQSNTNSVGLNVGARNARNSKYGRNYLKEGDTLAKGEFIGSPSGNCYLIMDLDKTTGKVGLQLRYDLPSCDGTAAADSQANAMKMYTIPKQNVSNMGKMGYVSEDGLLHEYPSSMIGPGSGYDLVGKYDSAGNTISQTTEATVELCKAKCSSTPGCTALVYGSVTAPMVRYIRVTANDGLGDGNERQALQISQIAVYSNGTNVALNKTTTTGPQYTGFPLNVKNYPVDGNLMVGAKRADGLFYHSSGNTGDFFQIDLGAEYPVDKLVYYSRGDQYNWRAAFQNIALLNGAKKEIKRLPLSATDVQTFTLTSETAGVNQCFLKNNKAYPMGNRQPNDNYELYMQNKKLVNNNSCSKTYETANTQTWELYPLGEKMSMDTLCSLGAATSQEQQELGKQKAELDRLAAAIKAKLDTLRSNDSAVGSDLDRNVKQMEKDLSAFQQVVDERQRYKPTSTNVDGMQEDASTNLTSQMYQHILYTILAILTVMAGTLAFRKMTASS